MGSCSVTSALLCKLLSTRYTTVKPSPAAKLAMDGADAPKQLQMGECQSKFGCALNATKQLQMGQLPPLGKVENNQSLRD